MRSKIFTSTNGWFNLTLPAEWEEYDSEEDGTYAFFNAASWTGNFRITSLQVRPKKNEDSTAKFINKELSENEGATKLKIGEFDCVHYKKDIEQDGDQLVTYYWTTGEKDILFICSFTIDKNMDNTKQNESELEIVQGIIKSIEINRDKEIS